MKIRANYNNIKDYLLVKYSKLKEWQRKPFEPMPLRQEETECLNCGHIYTGSYCPRCGQIYSTMRLGKKSAMQVFLDTWGLGTNSLLRTIWHLFSRPGYMIGDYLDGHRQPYFPPFKTLFVVGTFFAIIFALAGGFSEEAQKAWRQSNSVGIGKKLNEDLEKNKDNNTADRETWQEYRMKEQIAADMTTINALWDKYTDWIQHNYASNELIQHLIFALIAWRLFRKSPRRPKMNLAENVISQVYICAQLGVVSIVTMTAEMPFVPYPTGNINPILSFLLFFYDFKQLYGYGTWQTLWKTALMFLFIYFLFVFVFILILIGVSLHAGISVM